MSSGQVQWSDGHGSWVTPGGHANGQMVIGQIIGQMVSGQMVMRQGIGQWSDGQWSVGNSRQLSVIGGDFSLVPGLSCRLSFRFSMLRGINSPVIRG
jgi:hypothetical protein